jgi:hypothetical protein
MHLFDLYFACNVGDTWSENEILLFAVLIYFIDSQMGITYKACVLQRSW